MAKGRRKLIQQIEQLRALGPEPSQLISTPIRKQPPNQRMFHECRELRQRRCGRLHITAQPSTAPPRVGGKRLAGRISPVEASQVSGSSVEVLERPDLLRLFLRIFEPKPDL